MSGPRSRLTNSEAGIRPAVCRTLKCAPSVGGPGPGSGVGGGLGSSGSSRTGGLNPGGSRRSVNFLILRVTCVLHFCSKF